jgi:hypothetical protein
MGLRQFSPGDIYRCRGMWPKFQGLRAALQIIREFEDQTLKFLATAGRSGIFLQISPFGNSRSPYVG